MANASVFASLSAKLNFVKQAESIVVGMHYFANMVEYREISANQMGLPDSATGLMKETTELTSLGAGVGIDFATYYIVENYTTDTEKKRSGPKTYQIFAAATDSTG